MANEAWIEGEILAKKSTKVDENTERYIEREKDPRGMEGGDGETHFQKRRQKRSQ